MGLQFSGTAQAIGFGKPDQPAATVKFYPNPAVNFINFEFHKKYNDSYVLSLYNFLGKKIKEVKVSDQKIQVSLNQFYRGVYIFQLCDAQGKIIESGKFQVVK